MEIVKATVNATHRKLKAGWTMDWEDPSQSELIIRTVDCHDQIGSDGVTYAWGVYLVNCGQTKWKEMITWCWDTFPAGSFTITAGGKDFWFEKEKHRTFFLLHWS